MNHHLAPARMAPLYGFCHVLAEIVYDICFHGEVAGAENIPRTGGFIVAANHASMLDPPIVGCHVPRQLRFFARRTLWIGGVVSWWLDSVGTIPVDRDAGSDVAAIKRVLQVLKEGQASIVFPEGTRTQTGELQRPKAGVGLLACRTGVPVVPARVFGTFEAFGRKGPLRLGVPVSVIFGRPLLPSEYDRPEDGKDRYQRASERIMAAIAALEPPPPRVV